MLHFVLTVVALAFWCVAAAADTTALLTQSGKLRETVGGWKACDPDVEQWSGYFDVPKTATAAVKHYFYWAFGPRDKNVSAPVILWMTGGPGCSSSLALLAENGPCHMNETTGELYRNEFGWNAHAYLIYIDQPAGVGFSYTDNMDGYDSNEAEVSQDMYFFLQAFLTSHSAWVPNEFIVVGESYGGHFAPATAQRILAGNLKGRKDPHQPSRTRCGQRSHQPLHSIRVLPRLGIQLVHSPARPPMRF